MWKLHTFFRVPRNTLEKGTFLKEGLSLSYEMEVWVIIWPQMTGQVEQRGKGGEVNWVPYVKWLNLTLNGQYNNNYYYFMVEEKKDQKAEPIVPKCPWFFCQQHLLTKEPALSTCPEGTAHGIMGSIRPEANTWPKLSQSDPLSSIFEQSDHCSGLCQWAVRSQGCQVWSQCQGQPKPWAGKVRRSIE